MAILVISYPDQVLCFVDIAFKSPQPLWSLNSGESPTTIKYILNWSKEPFELLGGNQNLKITEI